MSLLVVGLSYRTAPVSLLERVTVGRDDLPKVLHELMQGGHLSEAVVLSSCNRIEVYAQVDRFHGGVHDVSTVLARRAGIEVQALGEHLYLHYEDAAILHLFSVASGLDSMVVGESQILGQLRSAYQAAADQQTVGRDMHELCQQALRVGKRVQTDTGIARAGASVVSVALDEAERVLGPIAGRRALVVGAGSMGALAATSLARAEIGELVLANRTRANAERLAGSLRETGTNARVVALDEVSLEVAAADVVVACTGAVGHVLGYDDVAAAVARRDGAPLALLDLALPRDVDSGVEGLPGVRYVDLAVLQALGRGAAAADDVEQAREIVSAEVSRYLQALRVTAVAPTVAALRVRAAEVVDAELLRLDGRLPGLDPRVRAEVAHAVHRVVQTLLHAPTVRVKELAGQPGGDAYADALRELFGLDPATTAAVASVSSVPATYEVRLDGEEQW